MDCICYCMPAGTNGPCFKTMDTFKLFHSRKKANAVLQTCLKDPLGVESLCELEPTDIWYAFWAIREYFTTNIVSEITGFLTKVKDCSNGEMVSVLRKVKLNLGNKIKRIKHSVVEKYLTKVVNELKWKEKGVFWLATYEQNQYITILIALRQNFGLYHNTTVDRSLDNILTNLADVFENGTFQYVVDGEYVEPDTMFACNDYICRDTYLHRNATYPMHQGNTETKSHEEQKHSHATIFGIIIAVFVGSCVAVVCFICLVIRVRLRPSDIRHVILTED